LKFEPEELSQLADAVSQKVLEKLRPLLANKDKDQHGDTIFTVETLAEYLDVEKDWVYSHIKEIPHFKVGRFPRFRKAEIDKWLEGNRAPMMPDVSSLTPFKLHRGPLDR
jgi:excisionase family DNA binding protein